jgi:hypothetical protein
MTQKLALFLSISITAFVLVVVGAAITIGSTALAQPAQPTLDPQLVADLQARETAYQGMIEQANAQLQQQATQPPATATPLPTTTPIVYPISPEAAAMIALLVAPGSYQKTPAALVDFQGTVAYEVSLNRGLVYVDASTGMVLYNGAYRPAVNVQPAPSTSSGGSSSDEWDD